MPKKYRLKCPVARSLDIVGDRWALLVVRDLLTHGARKFQDFEASLRVAPGVLSERLKTLEQAGVIARAFYSTHPPRAEYRLTPKGHDLRAVVGALAAWGAKHVYRHAQLVHDACGHDVEVGFYCAQCDRRVRRVRLTRAQG